MLKTETREIQSKISKLKEKTKKAREEYKDESITKFQVSLATHQLNRIDEEVKRRKPLFSRQAWIREAINEKLEREV